MPPNRFESEVESFLEGSHGDRTHIKRADHHTVTPLCGTLLVHHAPPVRKASAGLQGMAESRADAPSKARGVDGGRAGPTAPGTPGAQPTEHRRHSQQNTGGTANRTPVAQPTEHRRRSSNAGMREARRRVVASGPLRRAHLSLMRSSHVRRSPTRMPKSRFWSAIAASVAGFLMRAASTSGAAVMAPTP